MTFKRKALSALSRTELLEVGRALELDVTTNMRLDDLMDVVAGSKKRGMMEKILPVLTRDTLKAICEAVGISQEGREKQVLIDRILVAGGETGGEAEGDDKTPSPVAARVPAAKPDTRYLHATGTLADTNERVVVSFGPAHGALEQRQVEMAMREADELFPRPKMIVFTVFVLDPEAPRAGSGGGAATWSTRWRRCMM
jgi:hypothetical protein